MHILDNVVGFFHLSIRLVNDNVLVFIVLTFYFLNILKYFPSNYNSNLSKLWVIFLHYNYLKFDDLCETH